MLRNNGQPLPLVWVVIPFVFCLFLYWFLVQAGRPERPNPLPPQEAGVAIPEVPKQPVRPIDREEEAGLRDCFPWSVYYLQNLEYRPQAVICRGQLRTNPEAAYKTIRENIEKLFGDRFLVIFQHSFTGQPFFALVPNPARDQAQSSQKTEPITRPLLALSLLIITLFTTTIVGAEIAGVTEKAVQADPSLLLKGLPYAITLMIVLGIHETGHYLAARFYKIRATLPYFIPVPFFLGTFGAFIQMRSPVPNRKALFDVSIAGPFAGLIATLPFLMWGLANSTLVPLTKQSGILNFDSLNPNFSLLLMLLSKLTLGSQLTAQTAIDLHPVAVAGYLGLIVTAFNLMPVGQLDGGHIVHAMFGQRTSLIVGQVARVLMLLLSVLEPGLFLWAILLFLLPLMDEPALNDVSELNNWRDFWGLVALALLVMILLPAPKGLTEWLNF